MAYVKKDLNKDDWTLIATGVSVVTFQNASQYPIYINFTSTDTPPTDLYGIVYGPWQGELRKPLVTMTNVASPSRVWSKTVSTSGSVIVEE